MTAIARTRKEGELKSMTKQTPKSGKAKNGNEEKPSSLPRTLPVAVVMVSVRYPIILNLKSMEDRSILTYPVHFPTVTAVIPACIAGCSNAQVAEKLFQNPKVKDALRVLKKEIRTVLNPDESKETMPATKPTGKSIGSTIRKKSSIRKPENGK